MRRLAFLAIRGFGPGFLQAYIDGGVDDTGFGDVRAGEEDEFRLVKDAIGFGRVVVHSFDPIHGTG